MYHFLKSQALATCVPRRPGKNAASELMSLVGRLMCDPNKGSAVIINPKQFLKDRVPL